LWSTLCLWSVLLIIIGPNIALNQPASQGATVDNDAANKAVDGNSKTPTIGWFWWSVNFDKSFVLTGIRIINSKYAGMCVYSQHVGLRAFEIRIQKQSTTATLIKQSLAVLNRYHFINLIVTTNSEAMLPTNCGYLVCRKTVHT